MKCFHNFICGYFNHLKMQLFPLKNEAFALKGVTISLRFIMGKSMMIEIGHWSFEVVKILLFVRVQACTPHRPSTNGKGFSFPPRKTIPLCFPCFCHNALIVHWPVWSRGEQIPVWFPYSLLFLSATDWWLCCVCNDIIFFIIVIRIASAAINPGRRDSGLIVRDAVRAQNAKPAPAPNLRFQRLSRDRKNQSP